MTKSRTTRFTLGALGAGLAAAALAAGPAVAERPSNTDRPGKPEGKGNGAQTERGKPANRPVRRGDSVGASKRCSKGKTRGYVTAGTLVSHDLTVNENGTVDGTVVVDVDRTNKHARADEDKQITYTVDDTRLKVVTGDRSGDGEQTILDAAAGDRIKLIGRVTKAKKKCADNGSRIVTFRKVTIAPPRPAENDD